MVQTWVPSTMSPRSRGVFRNMLSFVRTKDWWHMGGRGSSSFSTALHISRSHTALPSELLTSPLWLAPLSSSAFPSTCLVPPTSPNRKQNKGSHLHPLSQKPWTQGMHAHVSCTLPGLPAWNTISAPLLQSLISTLVAPMAMHQLPESHGFLGTLMSPFLGLEAVAKAAYNLAWNSPPARPRGVQGVQPTMRKVGELSYPLSGPSSARGYTWLHPPSLV